MKETREIRGFVPPAQPPAEIQTIGYAAPGAFRGERRLKIIGSVSLLVSALSLLICGYASLMTFKDMSYASGQLAAGNQWSLGKQLDEQYWSDLYLMLIFGAMFLLALILLMGAVKLRRLDRRGLMLHWCYLVFQILLAVALAIDVMHDIYNSPAGMIFYVGVVPGLIAAAYPMILLPPLWHAQREK